MKHILILSDTHGLLREEVKALLDRADVVIHAGDLNTPAIVEALRAAGESYIVRGNNDKDWAADLPGHFSGFSTGPPAPGYGHSPSA